MLGALLLLQGAYAQKTKRPDWINGYFEELQNTYVEVVNAQGFEPRDARKKATDVLLVRRGLSTGSADVEVTTMGDDLQVKTKSNLLIKARIIDEYIEQIEPGLYQAYLLVQTAKNPTLAYDPIVVSDKYPFSARVFVPGMAQIYKGSVIKGSCLIAGEVLFVGGVVLTECLRQNYDRKLLQDPSAQQYADYANASRITRNVCIAGAVAVYAWNLIDGLVAKGNKQVHLGKYAELRLMPYVDIESGGMAAVVNF